MLCKCVLELGGRDRGGKIIMACSSTKNMGFICFHFSVLFLRFQAPFFSTKPITCLLLSSHPLNGWQNIFADSLIKRPSKCHYLPRPCCAHSQLSYLLPPTTVLPHSPTNTHLADGSSPSPSTSSHRKCLKKCFQNITLQDLLSSRVATNQEWTQPVYGRRLKCFVSWMPMYVLNTQTKAHVQWPCFTVHNHLGL